MNGGITVSEEQKYADIYTHKKDVKQRDRSSLQPCLDQRIIDDVIKDAAAIGELFGQQAALYIKKNNSKEQGLTDMQLCQLANNKYHSVMFKGNGIIPRPIDDAFIEAFWYHLKHSETLQDPTD